MRKYQARNYPCNIQSDDKLWCIVGTDNVANAGGILEWCYDQKDAEQLLKLMQATNEFSELEAIPYSEF